MLVFMQRGQLCILLSTNTSDSNTIAVLQDCIINYYVNH